MGFIYFVFIALLSQDILIFQMVKDFLLALT